MAVEPSTGPAMPNISGFSCAPRLSADPADPSYMFNASSGVSGMPGSRPGPGKTRNNVCKQYAVQLLQLAPHGGIALEEQDLGIVKTLLGELDVPLQLVPT